MAIKYSMEDGPSDEMLRGSMRSRRGIADVKPLDPLGPHPDVQAAKLPASRLTPLEGKMVSVLLAVRNTVKNYSWPQMVGHIQAVLDEAAEKDEGLQCALRSEQKAFSDIVQKAMPSAIDDLLETCRIAEQEGSQFPGMSYEDGIKSVLMWLRGEGDHPL